MALIPLGVTGANGEDGADATISIGTVTTGSAGSSATVTNSGTPSAAVLDFTIPRGATGAPGGYTSGPGYGTPTTITSSHISGTTPKLLTLPLPDANYVATLDDTLCGTTSYYRLVLPALTDEQAASAHWVRLTVTVLDRRREIGSKWWRETANARGDGSLLNRPTVVEPGPEPGATTTIDYEWIPAANQWVVRGHSGDALVRHHAALQGWSRSSTFASRLPAYASPELVRSSPSTVDDNITALAVVPSHIASALGRQNCWIDLGTTLDECVNMRQDAVGTYAPGGGFRAVGYMSDGAILAQGTGTGSEALLKGFTLLHELSHAIDYYWYAGANEIVLSGQVPSDALNLAGWEYFLFSRPDLQISNDPDLIALHNAAKATATLSAYYHNSAAEWFAQMTAVVLSSRIAGYNGSAWSTVKSAIQGNSTIYSDFEAFLGSVYVL